MSEKVTVTTVKGFDNAGTYARRGSQITVDEARARDLERNGLITRAAPAPANKMAPKPANKAGGKRTKKES